MLRVTAALAVGVTANACGGNTPRGTGTGTGADADAAGPLSQRDGGVRTTGGAGTQPLCFVTEVPLDPLPDQLTDFGSPTQVASRGAGQWTNRDGDRLVVTPAASGTYHRSTGVSSSCRDQSTIAVQAAVELDTSDGRFAESLSVTLQLHPNGSIFQVDEFVSDVKGTFRVQAPTAGALRWTGAFLDVWSVTGEFAQFVNGAREDAGQSARFLPSRFDTHSM